jgi:hypothetical protein
MDVLKFFNRVFKATRVRRDVDWTEMPSEPNGMSTDSETKANDLHAFRTITTMLSYIKSGGRPTEMEQICTVESSGDRKRRLRVLDALSAVLIRQYEVTAVVAEPHEGLGVGSEIQVFASVESGEGYGSDSDHQDMISTEFGRFTVTINPRESKINHKTDSLINLTSLPVIGDYRDKVPGDLVAVANSGGSLLDVYLRNHW